MLGLDDLFPFSTRRQSLSTVPIQRGDSITDSFPVHCCASRRSNGIEWRGKKEYYYYYVADAAAVVYTFDALGPIEFPIN
jgi:hypothetical protein